MQTALFILMLSSPLLAAYTYATYEASNTYTARFATSEVTLAIKKENQDGVRIYMKAVIPALPNTTPASTAEVPNGCALVAFNNSKQTPQVNAWAGSDLLFVFFPLSIEEAKDFGPLFIMDMGVSESNMTQAGGTVLGKIVKTAGTSQSVERGQNWLVATNAQNETSAKVETKDSKTTLQIEFTRPLTANLSEVDAVFSYDSDMSFSIISRNEQCTYTKGDDGFIYYTSPSEVYFSKVKALNALPNIQQSAFLVSITTILSVLFTLASTL